MIQLQEHINDKKLLSVLWYALSWSRQLYNSRKILIASEILNMYENYLAAALRPEPHWQSLERCQIF